MHDDTIRLTAFRTSVRGFCLIASRESDGNVQVFYACDNQLHRYTDERQFPDIRRMYPVHQYTVPPIVRARIREVFDTKGHQWLVKCP